MLPKYKQWKKWTLPSKLTAVGTYAGLIGLVLAIANMLYLNDESESVVRSKLVSIQEDVSKSIIVFQAHNLNPDFTSQDGAIRTMEKLNAFGSQTTAIFDYIGLSKLLKEYGNKGANEQFSFHLNKVHNKFSNLTDFVLNVINSTGPQSQEELDELTTQYVELLNQTNEAYQDYYSFVGNLQLSDFE